MAAFGATPLGEMPRTFSAMFLPRTNGLRSWPRPFNCVRACVQLLFEGGYYFFRRAPCACGYYSRAATNRGIQENTVLNTICYTVAIIFKFKCILLAEVWIDTQISIYIFYLIAKDRRIPYFKAPTNCCDILLILCIHVKVVVI